MLKEALAQEIARRLTAGVTGKPGWLRRRRLQCQLEKCGDDSTEDLAPAPPLGRTLMSHFPPAGAVVALAASMIQGAAGALLVASSRSADGVSTSESGAARKAVDVSAVTAPADDHLLAAASAVEEAMGGRGDRLFRHVGVDKSGASPEDIDYRRNAVGF